MSTPIYDENEAANIQAVARLAFARQQYPELIRAEARTRVMLAAAIQAFDEVEGRIEDGEKIHSLHEQAAVEQAKDDYAHALANLLRGETN